MKRRKERRKEENKDGGMGGINKEERKGVGGRKFGGMEEVRRNGEVFRKREWKDYAKLHSYLRQVQLCILQLRSVNKMK